MKPKDFLPVDAPEAGAKGAARSHLGRPSSWIMVAVMVVGFAVAGVGITLGPSWIVVIAGLVLFVVGGVAAYALGIMKDTGVAEIEEKPRRRPRSS
ncbi:HGxxPAAW family protein [Actinorugispora endophytica]|uniref:Uncharacterized protein n=1 Tax=Actinorugispora endophytica TaxID=1605990 RepID=A0A4R6UIJ3_9ACTN|nr:HGxxPAAW family protein [Actinorugispora endophytica]TDQ45886.1 hypothetical protein EV190_12843 [Actinorugispora endophytica]